MPKTMTNIVAISACLRVPNLEAGGKNSMSKALRSIPGYPTFFTLVYVHLARGLVEYFHAAQIMVKTLLGCKYVGTIVKELMADVKGQTSEFAIEPLPILVDHVIGVLRSISTARQNCRTNYIILGIPELMR